MPETGFKSSDIRAVLSSKLFKVLHCKIKKFAILLIILRTMLNCRVRDVSPYQFQPHGRVRGVRRSVSGGRSVRTASLDLLPPHSPAVCCSQSWRYQVFIVSSEHFDILSRHLTQKLTTNTTEGSLNFEKKIIFVKYGFMLSQIE